MKEIVIDGVRFVPASETGDIKIVILERGFVYIGRVLEEESQVVINGARSLIRWGTDAHLGQLVDGPQPNTKLGSPCSVRARWEQIIHMIEVDQNAWNKHIS